MVLKRSQQKQKGPPAWMISFTDVISLMLTFFVLLFAMSEPKTEEWNLVSGVLRDSFGLQQGDMTQVGQQDQDFNILDINKDQGLDLTYLGSLIERQLSRSEIVDQVSVHNRYDSLVITLPSDLVFQSGDTRLSSGGARVMKIFADLLGNIQNHIDIYGHADERPVNSRQYPSNWELALWRAETVAQTLRTAGYRKPIMTYSMGSSRSDELPNEMTEQKRLALARRVDIVIREDRGPSQ